MATLHKTHWLPRWRHESKSVTRDPAKEQLRRDRMTALIAIGISVLIVGLIVAIALLGGVAPAGPEMMDPWIMP